MTRAALAAAGCALALLLCAPLAWAQTDTITFTDWSPSPTCIQFHIIGTGVDSFPDSAFVGALTWRDSTPEQQAAARWRASYRIIEPTPWWAAPWARATVGILLALAALALLYRHGRIEDAEWPEDCDGGEPIR